MCLAYKFKIRPNNPSAPVQTFVQCGVCEECRAVQKSSWAFRLTAEIEYLVKRNWNVCFFTLTYNDDHLPRFPLAAFKADADISLKLWEKICSSVMCFSRDDITRFVHSVREWLWREYGVGKKGSRPLSYFIASEFGSSTQRSHYHGIFCVPPQVDTARLHAFILQCWMPKGHVFPRYPNGGMDSHGYNHKPFVCRSPNATARYCAKYVCKDLNYQGHLSSLNLYSLLDTKSRAFKRCDNFHVQSRSLGVCLTYDLSDSQKLELITHGYCFLGDTRFRKIPVYIRNKLIFDNKYVFDQCKCAPDAKSKKELGLVWAKEDFYYRRRVLREANEFFKTYAKEIFEAKVVSYTDFFKKLGVTKNYTDRGVPLDVGVSSVRLLSTFCAYWHIDYRQLAIDYLCYAFVAPERRCSLTDDEKYFQYLSRYCDVDLPLEVPLDNKYLRDLEQVCSYLFKAFFYSPVKQSEMQKISEFLCDYFGHLE